jgi:replicative DNA helicase
MFAPVDTKAFVREMAFHYAHPGRMRGVPTGFAGVDRLLRGMKPGLYVLAGRPSTGKSAVALQIAYNVATTPRDPDHPDAGTFRVFFATQEMATLDCANRLAASIAGIPTDAIEFGFRWEQGQKRPLAKEDYTRFREAGEHLAQIPLYFRENAVTVEQLIREVKERRNAGEAPDLVIVDYLTYLLPPRPGMKDYDAINENLFLLKDHLVVPFHLPVLVVAQLSRGVEGRENKRPTLSDLEGSGRIEQRAKGVIMLYNADYYARMADPENYEPTGKLEAAVLKNQGGRTGVANLHYDMETQRITDFHEPYDVPTPVKDEPPANVVEETGELLF